jgi:hypothetical protein
MDEDEGFERAPDGIVPLVGYRLWRVEDPYGEPAFLPLTRLTPEWTGATRGWVSASCRSVSGVSVFDTFRWEPIPHHRVPHEGCSCGFYAMKELDPKLVLVVSTQRLAGTDGVLVLGRVELAGKIIEHDLGYRAERARIVELVPLRGDKGPAKAIARRAGVDLARAVKVPRTPMRERVRDWRVAWETTKASTQAQRRNQDVVRVLVVAWLLFRAWIAVHGSGGTP